MTEPTTNPADDPSLQSQALDWLLALEDADAATLARFDAWLAESAEHRAAFEHARACWQSSTLVDALPMRFPLAWRGNGGSDLRPSH